MGILRDEDDEGTLALPCLALCDTGSSGVSNHSVYES